MKKILLATTLLAGFAGAASAEVALSGDARMGIISDFGPDDGAVFTSRARVKFSMSGTTDGGLEFGAEFRADNADAGDDGLGGAEKGQAGKVFIKGAFGTLSMGDVDGAALAAVGDVDGVGLTGLGDFNESVYLSRSDIDPSVLYEYSTGNLAFYASASQREEAAADVLALGAKYSTDAFTVALGYESGDFGAASVDHLIIGASTTFSNVTLKAKYGMADLGGADDATQMAVSATYAMDALAATIFYNDEDDFNTTKAFGIGASYDLGGGASVKAGYVNVDSSIAGVEDDDAFDLGIAMEF